MSLQASGCVVPNLRRFINSDTLLSLQVVESEYHPNSHNQGPTKATSGSKEGLSVYGLFHHLARTPQGRALLRQFFLRPSTSFEIIHERQSAISIFIRPENATVMDNLVKNLQSVKNVRVLLVNLRKGLGGGLGRGQGYSQSVWTGVQAVSV